MTTYRLNWPLIRWVKEFYLFFHKGLKDEYEDYMFSTGIFTLIGAFFSFVIVGVIVDSHPNPHHEGGRDLQVWGSGHPHTDMILCMIFCLPFALGLFYGACRWVLPSSIRGLIRVLKGCVPKVRFVRVPVDLEKTAKLEQELQIGANRD